MSQFPNYMCNGTSAWVWTLNTSFNSIQLSCLCWLLIYYNYYTPAPRRGKGVYCFTSVCLSVLPSVQDIFRRIFLSNCCWQESDIWSQASYRYTILWVAFLNPSDSYFLFADLVGFYTHSTYMHIFLSNYWWQKSDIWSQASYRSPYRGKRFWTHRIPTSCLPTLLIFIHIEHICSFFVGFFSATIDGRNLIFGHKLHIGTSYHWKRFWTHQIPTSCLPILLIFIRI
jgi:hypothetical protein